MSICLPHDRGWSPANWVLRNFFDQAQSYLHLAPHLADEMKETITTGLTILDLENSRPEAFHELKVLTDKVIEFNRQQGSAGWQSPEFYPGYMARLEELRALCAQVLGESVPPDPTPSPTGR